MGKSSVILGLFLVLLTVFAALPPGKAWAQATEDGGNVVLVDKNGDVCPGEGYSQRVVGCIKAGVLKAAEKFLGAFYGTVKAVIYAAITLAVVFFGLQLLMGSYDKPAKEMFILLLKIGAVFSFTADFNQIFQMILDMMDGFLKIVQSSTIINNTELNCAGKAQIWSQIDCVIDRVIGITPQVTVKSGIVGVLFALLFSGAVGFILFFIGMAFLLMLLSTIAQAIFIFIMAYIALSFMVILAPLIVPMVLFNVTRGIFDRWVQMIGGFALQPVFLFAYLAMMLTAFDVMVLTGNTSLYRTMAGDAALAKNFSIADYFEENNLYTKEMKMSVVLDILGDEESKPVGKQETGLFGEVGKLRESVLGTITDALGKALDIGLPFMKVDFDKMAQVRGMTTKQLMPKLFISFATAALMAYVMYSMLSVVATLGHEVTGGIAETINLGQFSDGKKGSIFGSAGNAASSATKSMLKKATGG